MIGVDVVAGDVGEIVRAEQELVGDDVGRDLPGERDVGIGIEAAIVVSGGELHAHVVGFFVVERGEHIRRAELSVVEQVLGDLVIGVDADLEVWSHLLHHANVEHVRSLRQHRIVLVDRRLLGGAVHQREIGRRRQHLRRRREVARVAGVEGGAVERLVGDADPRRELVGVGVGIHLVETKSGVECDLVGDLPLVGGVGAEQPAEL